MNRKQLIVLILLVAVIGGASVFLIKRKDSSWSPSDKKLGQKLFPKLPINDVAHIQIKQSADELNLVKEDVWRVRERGGYEANFSQISDFLLKAAQLKIGQSEEIGQSQFAKLELLDPATGQGAGTLLQFKDKSDKILQSAILGKTRLRKSAMPSQFNSEGSPDGRYVLLPNDSKHALLLSDPLSDVEAKPANWLNKDFFKVEKVKSISLVSTNATNSWKISRTNEASSWVLADVKPGEDLDTNKVSGVANSFAAPSFVDVLVNAKSDDTGLDKPTVVTLETFEGFTYTLNIGKQLGEENYPLSVKVSASKPTDRVVSADEKAEDKTKLDKEFADNKKKLEEKLAREKALEKWTYLVAKWTVDPLHRDRAQLMMEKKEEPQKETSKEGGLLDPLGTEDPTVSPP